MPKRDWSCLWEGKRIKIWLPISQRFSFPKSFNCFFLSRSPTGLASSFSGLPCQDNTIITLKHCGKLRRSLPSLHSFTRVDRIIDGKYPWTGKERKIILCWGFAPLDTQLTCPWYMGGSGPSGLLRSHEGLDFQRHMYLRKRETERGGEKREKAREGERQKELIYVWCMYAYSVCVWYVWFYTLHI